MRKKLSFAKVEPTVPLFEGATTGSLSLIGTTKNGSKTFDFSDLTGTQLERAFILAFAESLTQLRLVTAQANMMEAVVKHFCRYVRSESPSMVEVKDMTSSIFDGWIRLMMPNGPEWGSYEKCRVLFRIAKELPDDLLPSEARQRLQYIHPQGGPPRVPRDAYSDGIISQLIKACRSRIPEITKRLTRDADTILQEGTDPRKGGHAEWNCFANRVYLAEKIGPLRWRHVQALTASTGGSAIELRIDSVNAALFPSESDLVPFYLLHTIETGWPQAVTTDMTVDCRTNITPERAVLNSIKYRAGHKIVSRPVRANGTFSPARVAEHVIAIGARLRATSNRQELWLSYASQSGTHVAAFRGGRGSPLARFLAEIDLRDDDGNSVRTLSAGRIRKSHHARWYKKTLGQIDQFAGKEHSREVAANNYGNIPALHDLHEQAIAAGQSAAFDAAMSTKVTSAMSSSQVALDLDIPEAEAKAICGGQKDVWVSACRDLNKSPFSAHGKPCKARPGPCFDCKNSVILNRHLPRVIAYYRWIVTERDTMDGKAWEDLHGLHYRQIQGQVLPSFSPAEISRAEGATDSSGYPLLPPTIVLRGIV